MKRILLVGGGTAGHVEPALAVGNWLLVKSSDISCEFVGTKSGIENELVPLAGLKLHHILKYKYRINSNYDPCSYPGIQCEFHYDDLNAKAH